MRHYYPRARYASIVAEEFVVAHRQTNAFNEVSRAVMLRRILRRRFVQHWWPLLHRLWGPETMLLIGRLMIELFEGERPGGLSEGVQQGTPPSGPGFCIGIQRTRN